MAEFKPPTDQTSFLAAIGHVCLQWSLLEQNVLFIIGCIETQPIEKVYLRYGGLDMLPRLGMAINLAQEAKWPHKFVKRIRDIRRALQKEGKGLAERRNLFVHGAQKQTEIEGEFALTMARWKGDKREQTVSITDVVQVACELALLANEAHGIFVDYGVWKFGTEPKQDRCEQVAKAIARARFVRAQQIKRALKLLWANLRP